MQPFLSDPDLVLYNGDALSVLRELEAESVHCVVTSPPYFGLRDYGTGEWNGGEPDCDHLAPPGGGTDATGLMLDGRLEAARQGNAERIVADRRQQYRALCARCGATRVDRQLGLERTPNEYVAALVEVFREIRRVLRSDGTAWLNLGDSYARPVGKGVRGPSDKQDSNRGTPQAMLADVPPGLKEKDLVGIPWRVAQALQEPYYAGRIQRETDRVWLAAMIEAEGSIYIGRQKIGSLTGRGGRSRRTQDSFGPGVTISSTDLALIERVAAIAGTGHPREVPARGERRAHWVWTVTGGKQVKALLREVYPYFVAKHHEARLAHGCPSSGDDAARAWEGLKLLHKGGETGIDFPAPESLFEPGWYLRSAIVWSKPNPMPESVTDRPTQAHEFVYLLAKSPRYFFDPEPVREAFEAKPQRRLTSTSEQPLGAARAAAGVQNGCQGGTQGAPPPQAETLGDLPPEAPRGADGRRKTKRVENHEGRMAHKNYANAYGGERWPSGGRNIRNVWEIATQPTPEAHFATFPEELVRRCILAGTSERGCCPECGAPWVREIASESSWAERKEAGATRGNVAFGGNVGAGTQRGVHGEGVSHDLDAKRRETIGWRPGCDCFGHVERWTDEEGGECSRYVWEREAPKPVPAVVLDPFLGSGTTAVVARAHGRRCVGIELSEDYCRLIEKRTQQLSLLAGDAA